MHARFAAALGAALAALACSASVLPLAPSEPSPVRIDYYPVAGRSVWEIRRALLRNGPRDRHGKPRAARTDWTLAWRYAVRPEPGACVLTQVEASVAITTTLPDLSTPVPLPVRAEWNALAGRLASVRAANGCAALHRALERTGRTAVAECRARDDGFDRETNHGVAHRPR